MLAFRRRYYVYVKAKLIFFKPFPLIKNYLTWAPGSQMSGVNFSGGYPKLFEGSLHIPLSSHPARRLPADGDLSYQLNFVVVTREPVRLF